MCELLVRSSLPCFFLVIFVIKGFYSLDASVIPFPVSAHLVRFRNVVKSIF